MRQVIFVVVMVGAAFLGGAVVNGPGLRWVQARLLDYMGLQDGGEIASIDLTAGRFRPRRSPPARETLRWPACRILKPRFRGPRARRSSRVPQALSAVGSGRSRSSTPPSSAVPPPLPLPTTIPEPGLSRANHRNSHQRRNAWLSTPSLEPPMEPGKAGS